MVCRDLGDLDGADAAIRPILGQPWAPGLHLAGLIVRDRGDSPGAVGQLRRALVADPGHSGAWQALAGVLPLGNGSLLRATARAVVDPGDAESWRGLLFVILASPGPGRASTACRRLDAALARLRSVDPPAVAATELLLADRGVTACDRTDPGLQEDRIATLIQRMAVWSRDDPVVRRAAIARLRRLAARHPDRRIGWLALLGLQGDGTRPGDGELVRRARHVVAFGGLHAEASALRRPYEACVAAKTFTMVAGNRAASMVGHALGLQALCDRVDRPVSLRWGDCERRVRIGDREIGYAISSPGVLGFVSRLFLFEPGLWRWMAGFGPRDVLLDVGANVGIYSVAAAGLFGVRVAALEPYAPNLQTLRQNVADNRLGDRIAVLPVAATAVETAGRLLHGGGAAGAADQHFVADGGAAAAAEASDRVDGVPVDLLVARGAIPFPTRVKIDVDGNELAVVEGMARTLADRRLHGVRMEVRWQTPEGRAAVERIEAFGFRAAVDDDSKNLLFTRPPRRTDRAPHGR